MYKGRKPNKKKGSYKNKKKFSYKKKKKGGVNTRSTLKRNANQEQQVNEKPEKKNKTEKAENANQGESVIEERETRIKREKAEHAEELRNMAEVFNAETARLEDIPQDITSEDIKTLNDLLKD